jgi:hypothetical protein
VTAITPEEAETFLQSSVTIISQIEERERKPGSAIPRDLMNCGEAITLLSALVALIAIAHPRLVEDSEIVADLAAINIRGMN